MRFPSRQNNSLVSYVKRWQNKLNGLLEPGLPKVLLLGVGEGALEPH